MIAKKEFGRTPDGRAVTLYSISNEKGLRADVMNYGAILVNLFVPDKKGETADITCGYDRLEEYFDNDSFFGATVGPVANRTAGAQFVMDGVTYKLDVNDGENNLHSHMEKGMHKSYYEGEIDADKNSVRFSILLQDGELGLPGNRQVTVSYTVTEDNGLKIEYKAVTDKKTMFNPTNHSYFNLKGHDAGSVLDETLWLNCSAYTEIVDGAIPTGRLVPVAGTPLDFTVPTVIGERVDSDFEQMTMVSGYDHNFVIGGEAGTLRKAAVLSDEAAGRTMEVYTDMPGIQVYTGNHIELHEGKKGADYDARCAIALETQYFPNSTNEESFAAPVLEPGKEFYSETVYKFV